MPASVLFSYIDRDPRLTGIPRSGGIPGVFVFLREIIVRGSIGFAKISIQTLTLLLFIARGGATQQPAGAPGLPPPAAQNPSPMVEHTRAHVRLAQRTPAGSERSFAGPAGKAVLVFVPAATRHAGGLRLVVHFLGAPFVPEYAVSRLGGDHLLAVVNVAPGTGAYARPFAQPAAYDSLLAGIRREAGAALGRAVAFRSVTLVGFSAGHGAIREILRDSAHFAGVDAVLLLDGMHTGYVPDRRVLADGGQLDTTNLVVWERFAREAMAGRKRFLVTHSEIFPGTFASTTETADWLLATLGLRRTPVLRWGPGGMQQLSDTRAGRFRLMGFAGNSAPDHIDQLQGEPEFLALLERM